LTWTSSDPNAPAALSDYNIVGGLTSLQVPIEDDAMVAVLVGPLQMKGEPWFQALLAPGGTPFNALAQITFKGHVSGTDHEVLIPAGLMVNFVGAVSE
jgi:hypothetical protein